MSRVIKYRQRLNNRMAVIQGSIFHYWGYIDGGFVSPMGKNFVYDGSESEQYTGLTDKNGIEIYEGDILANEYSQQPYGVHDFKVIVERIDTEWCGWNIKPALIPNMGAVVIGNIHQNPELLEGEG